MLYDLLNLLRGLYGGAIGRDQYTMIIERLREYADKLEQELLNDQ